MIKLIDTKATIKFIPESEKGSDKPTTFHIKPATWRNSLGLARLFEIPDLSQATYERSWIDYMIGRIEAIDNVGDKSVTEVLSSLSIDDGNELLVFIKANTNMNEAQAKN